MGGGRRCKGTATSCRVLLLAAVVICCIGSSLGICVVDNKKGWSVSCGVRDSYLFRLKDYGGINANFDFSVGFGNEKGFPFSIKNTKGKHHYHRRKDEAGGVLTSGEITEEEVTREAGGGGGSWSQLRPNLRPPPHIYNTLGRSSVAHSEGDGTQPVSDDSSVPSSGAQNTQLTGSTDGGAAGDASGVSNPYVAANHLNHLSAAATRGGSPRLRPARRRSGTRRSSSSFFSRLIAWLPWPFGEASWFSGGSSGTNSRADSRKSHFRVIHQPVGNDLSGNPQSFNTKQSSFPHPFSPQSFGPQSFGPQSFGPQSFSPQSFAAPPFLAPPFASPFSPFQPFPQPQKPQSHGSPPRTVGPQVADVLQVSPDTPADTDHVPSFAAKVFVVREAPKDYYPPGYTPSDSKEHHSVEVPRTKFFCEEQRYLPGLYADTQLGCKVFHMCLPAAVGNTMTSFLCPNMTLFDQSILQCNWWYYVRCEDSHLNYDANLPLALSYRKVNAAQLPLTAIKDYNSLSLLDISARTPRKLEGGTEGAIGRMGLADVEEKEEDKDDETVARDFEVEKIKTGQDISRKDVVDEETVEEETVASDTEEQVVNTRTEAGRRENGEEENENEEQEDDEDNEEDETMTQEPRRDTEEDETEIEKETDERDNEDIENEEERTRDDIEAENEEEKTTGNENSEDRVKRSLSYKLYNTQGQERLLHDRKLKEVEEHWERDEIKRNTGFLSRNKRHEHKFGSVLLSRLRIRDLAPYS